MSGITPSLRTIGMSEDLLTADQEWETKVINARGSPKMKYSLGPRMLLRSSLLGMMKVLFPGRPPKMRRRQKPKFCSHPLASLRL
jgi:hypothetical protein